jgi:hypothetical protein
MGDGGVIIEEKAVECTALQPLRDRFRRGNLAKPLECCVCRSFRPRVRGLSQSLLTSSPTRFFQMPGNG